VLATCTLACKLLLLFFQGIIFCHMCVESAATFDWDPPDVCHDAAGLFELSQKTHPLRGQAVYGHVANCCTSPSSESALEFVTNIHIP